jgi:hypothetical protein
LDKLIINNVIKRQFQVINMHIYLYKNSNCFCDFPWVMHLNHRANNNTSVDIEDILVEITGPVTIMSINDHRTE